MVKQVRPIPKPRKAHHFIREWRKYRGLTQEQLAERIEQTSGAISQLENGIINYTQPTLEALAAALNCEPGDLLSRDPAIDDAVAELQSILKMASGPDQARALRVIREMLSKTGTEG
jgi:transcriptional regulator with XRE-family HTH domain